MRNQRGFSLVEILISITIGLVILGAIGVVYVSSSNINRQKEDLAEVNEPIKIINNLLKYNVAQAGYVDIFDGPAADSLQASNLFYPGNAGMLNIFMRNPATIVGTPLSQVVPGLLPVFGCDGAMDGSPNALATTAPPVSLTCGTASATKNTVQFAYQAITMGGSGIGSLAASSATTGEGLDCLQQPLPGTSTVVVNRFSVVANSGDGVNELYCEGSGDTIRQPIARGVEEMVVRYQMAQPGSSGATVTAGSGKAQYLTATQVAADSVKWAGVTGVEICIIVATPQTKGAAARGTVQLQPTRPTCTRDSSGAFDANIARESTDLRLWKRSTFTYTVRNAIFATPV